MEKIDLISLVLVITGSVMVYGAKGIYKILKINTDEIKVLLLKLAGLAVALVGFLRILDVI